LIMLTCQKSFLRCGMLNAHTSDFPSNVIRPVVLKLFWAATHCRKRHSSRIVKAVLIFYDQN
ncbi:hypothetical protein T4B_11336, partial [Trichinella pseudospiralis]